MDAATLQALVAEAVAQALAATATTRGDGGGGGSNNGGAAMIHKFYARLEKLDGDQWKEWSYQFAVATNTYKPENGELLEAVEKLELDDVTTVDIELELSQKQADHMKATQAEMFGVLSLLTKGEANMLVRSCVDKNGYAAYKKLFDRYNPRTPASLTAAWREVIRPKKVKDMREAGKAIDAWEAKVTTLKKEHGEEPTMGLKASLMLEMLPDNVQLTVAQGMTSKRLDYDALKTKIKLMANVQIDYTTPKPMDIGEMDGYDEEEHVWTVGALKGKGKGKGYGTCWTCGGKRFPRECPKRKGKGDEKGKGKGKSTGPMFGSCWSCGGNHFARDCPKGEGAKGGGKGKGKSIQCYNCGGVGHRAAQCPTQVREVDQDEGCEDSELADVSEGWGIQEVNEWREVKKKRRGGDSKPMVHNTALSGRPATEGTQSKSFENRFEVLKKEETEEEWILEAGEHEGPRPVGKGEIVVDSGAAESVCPWDWAEEFPMKEVPWEQRRKFVNASGKRMGHYGQKTVHCKFEGQTMPASLKFQVSDCKNPLCSVARIVERGNIVQFGPKEEDNYIFNPDNGEKVRIRKRGRKFVLDVDLVRKGAPFSRQA